MNNKINDNKEISKKQKIFSKICTIWFIGSILACMILINASNQYYIFFAFGQFFLGNGILLLLPQNEGGRILSLPFILVGAGFIIIPYLMNHPELFKFTIIWEEVISLIIVSMFLAVGISIIIIPIITNKKRKKICNKNVFSTIIEYKTDRSNGRGILYCPIYSFEYNNVKYEVSNNFYTNIDVKPVGTSVKLAINPLNPNEFIPNDNSIKISLIFGIFFLIPIIPIFIYIITNFQFIK